MYDPLHQLQQLLHQVALVQEVHNLGKQDILTLSIDEIFYHLDHLPAQRLKVLPDPLWKHLQQEQVPVDHLGGDVEEVQGALGDGDGGGDVQVQGDHLKQLSRENVQGHFFEVDATTGLETLKFLPAILI